MENNPVPGLRKGSLARKLGYIQQEQAYPRHGGEHYLAVKITDLVGVERGGLIPSHPDHVKQPHVEVEIPGGERLIVALDKQWGEILSVDGTRELLIGKAGILWYRGEGRKAMRNGRVKLAATPSNVPMNEDNISGPYSVGVQTGVIAKSARWRISLHSTSQADGEA